MPEPAIRPIPSHGESYLEDLMGYRVREVLLVASAYDSYILEEDGQLAESLDVEFYQLKLSWAPRITTVTNATEAMKILDTRPFDLVITKSRIGDMELFEFSRAAKKLLPDIPVVLLADNPIEANRVKEMGTGSGVDQAFVWRGDVKVFLAIVKYIEDRRNVERDTEIAGVRTIILIENSVRFYSSYLPLLYSELMKQTNSLMADGVNTAQRLRRMKARAKVLLAETFEEGWALFKRYKENTLGIITDARFPREGRSDPQAGLEFVRRVHDVDVEMPALVQSTDESLSVRAALLGAAFVNKRNPRLLYDVRNFLQHSLGFGDFVFREPDGAEVCRVRDLAGMPEALHTIPPDSIIYHATRNHFSNWLMARTEFGLAALLRPKKVHEFEDAEHLRDHLITIFKQALADAHRGVVAEFSRHSVTSSSGFARIGQGSMGGKGRGLGFVHSVLSGEQLENKFENARVFVPQSSVIGTEIFDDFLDRNDLRELALADTPDEEIVSAFLQTPLPKHAMEDLQFFLDRIKYPLAVRSSGLLEDSHDQPFAGIYRTYMLPNNHPDPDVRLEQLSTAIRLVYTSTFSRNARSYLRSTPYRLEEERMAVVLQRLIGRKHESYFYPDFSGVARSYNFYPVLDMNAEDGVATVALGLGRTVVEGEKAVRFSPARPRLLPQFSNTEDFLENAQREFYALDMQAIGSQAEIAEERDLHKLHLTEAERHGVLRHVASVYSADNDAVYDGISRRGTRLVTFAPILKSSNFPLAGILTYLLDLFSEAMCSAVEIEFAVDMEPIDGGSPEFGILQVRPMNLEMEARSVTELPEAEPHEILCSSENVLGHGRIYGLGDIIYVRPEAFDRSATQAIASEIGNLNDQLHRAGRHYLLIGPGRWGSADRWLGVPVEWGQISEARAIIETGLSEVPVTPSEGTHFFQNLISFGIGYFHVHGAPAENWVDYDWLEQIPAQNEGKFVRHVRMSGDLTIVVDGHQRRGRILKPDL